MDVPSRIAHLGGAARFNELATSRYRLAALVDSGLVEQIGRGCYALPSASPAVRKAVKLNAAVSCVSALREYGYDIPGDASVIHCSVPRKRGSSYTGAAGCRRHFEDVGTGKHPRIVSLLAASARAAVCLEYDAAVVALDRVAHGRSPGFRADLLNGVSQLSRSRGAALSIDVDGRSRSKIETEARLALRRAGLRVEPGVVVPGVGEVDLLVEGVLIIELDGFAFHSDRRSFRRDRTRSRTAQRLGLATARFAYEDSSPATLVTETHSLLRALAASPPRADPEIQDSLRTHLDDLRLEATAASSTAQGWPHLTESARRSLQWLPDGVASSSDPLAQRG